MINDEKSELPSADTASPTSGEHISTSSDTVNPTHIGQILNADWIAIANLLSTALVNAANSESQNQKPKTDRIAIITVMISAFTLFATLFLGTFGTLWVNSRLNQQNADLQMSLEAYKNELTTANLQISSFCPDLALACSSGGSDIRSSGSIFMVSNNGPAPANNISIDVGIYAGDIKTLNNLTISPVFPISSGISIMKNPRNTIFTIKLDSLSKQSSIGFRIQLSPSANLFYVTRPVTLSLHSKNHPQFNYHDYPIFPVIGQFLEEQYNLATDFLITISCANCAKQVQSITRFSILQDLQVQLKPQNTNASVLEGTIKVGYATLDEKQAPLSLLPPSLHIRADIADPGNLNQDAFTSFSTSNDTPCTPTPTCYSG